MNVHIIGAGVMGLALAAELVDEGVSVDVYEQSSHLGEQACSWFAGGMLAPWCEVESAEKAVLHYGKKAFKWWQNQLADTDSDVSMSGTLVVAQKRDRNELARFARRTENFMWLDQDGIEKLEPDLGESFQKGLYFPDEAHLNPRLALVALTEKLKRRGVVFHFSTHALPGDFHTEVVVDCRGLQGKGDWPAIRGVKGEMLIIQTDEIVLQRPIRLLHPRIPLYIVPRGDGCFMVGATMLENAQRERFSVRSMLELLSSAYALHPSFAEAEIIETGVDARPAFPDNLPRLEREANVWRINGLYRHGFLLSPSMAKKASHAILKENYKLEQMNEYHS